jgi:glycosyltransferase involved in cell wall biosynthesis
LYWFSQYGNVLFMTDGHEDVSALAPIVVFGDDWQRFVSTLQHLFAHIVARRAVVWVNSFGHRAPRLTVYDLRRALSKLRAMVRQPTPRDDGRPAPARIIQPRALPWHNVAAVRALNTWSLLRDIRHALTEVAPGRAPVLVTGGPAAEGVVGALGELAAIYFCMDDYAEMPGVDRHIVAPLEPRLLAKVDATVATAAALTVLKRPASGCAYHLPQGVNYDHFALPRPAPEAIAQLPEPRIGFSGTLSSACDFRIFHALSEAFPSGSIVHVGPIQAGIQLPHLPNLRLLGHQTYEDLPSYVQYFDVGIIPYVLNDWTRSVDPLKLLEYLATGIPVVSTSIPEVHKYENAVAVAEDVPGFIEAVRHEAERSRNQAGREARQALARRHTWKHRADRFLEIVSEVARTRARQPVPPQCRG